jgi:hypothetical protein
MILMFIHTHIHARRKRERKRERGGRWDEGEKRGERGREKEKAYNS